MFLRELREKQKALKKGESQVQPKAKLSTTGGKQKRFNKLTPKGIAGYLHANFDRQQPAGQNVDPASKTKRGARVLRPGAIILPNLDIDHDETKPRTRRSYNQADALADDKVNDGDDHQDITQFIVAEPKKPPGNADKVVLSAVPEDAKRIRVWLLPSGATDPRAKGVREVIGPKAGRAYLIHDRNAHVTGQGKRPAKQPWEACFYVEALTLAGDPRNAGPKTRSASPPGKRSAPPPNSKLGSEDKKTRGAANLKDTAKGVYAGPQATGDVWLQLYHQAGGKWLDDLRDVGLFTIAPWIMTWNTLPCQRVYVVYIRGRRAWKSGKGKKPDARTLFKDTFSENHPMVWDLRQACSQRRRQAIGTVKAPDKDTTKAMAVNTWKDISKANDVPFYVISGGIVRNAKGKVDRWTQDEFEIGYCYAPHHWLHVALHTPRGKAGLNRFVSEYMAHPRLGVFRGVNLAVKKKVDETNYGGNLEVSPPVAVATPELPKGPAGPKIKKHRRAPFGKIILGDCKARPASNELRWFLFDQRVQPVLAVDTSWLQVGHVDEMMTFVGSDDKKGPGYKLLIADVPVMTRLLREVYSRDKAATMNAGKYNIQKTALYAEDFVRSWLAAGTKSLRTYSERVQKKKVDPIKERLKAGLGLGKDDAHILPIPTYWEIPKKGCMSDPGANKDARTIAENAGMVNMLVVDDHLMVPRPHGPRLPRTQAEEAVRACLDAINLKGVKVSMPPENSLYFWARPGEDLQNIAAFFLRPRDGLSLPEKEKWRREIINRLKWDARRTFTGATGKGPKLTLKQGHHVGLLVRDILADLQNNPATNPITTVARKKKSAYIFDEWMRIRITAAGPNAKLTDTVDVFEVYMKSILEHIGNKVHFIEAFESYHALSGEVHCGTNAKRRPPEESTKFKDRWWDERVYDPSYDTHYGPPRS